MPVAFFGLSETADRDTNDDSFVADPEAGIFAVADGIGGRPGASSASRAAVSSLVRRLGEGAGAGPLGPQGLRSAVAAVNADVIAVGQADPALTGLGTTLSALVLADGTAWLLHLGDSRVYRLRAGGLDRLTRDHTVAQELVRLNRLRPEEAASHPLRGMLSRFLGSATDAEPDVEALPLVPDESFLVLTDGLCSVLDEEELGRLAAAARPSGMEAVCRALVAEALRRHPTDNLTVVAVTPSAPGDGP
jgi:protein phosphatase